MIVEQVWTANDYRNFNYLVACPETGEALVELKSLGVDLPIVAMPPGSPDEVGRILEEVIGG